MQLGMCYMTSIAQQKVTIIFTFRDFRILFMPTCKIHSVYGESHLYFNATEMGVQSLQKENDQTEIDYYSVML